MIKIKINNILTIILLIFVFYTYKYIYIVYIKKKRHIIDECKYNMIEY